MNLGEPSIIGRYKHLPFDGIGLMRTEFIFTNMVGAHPMYLVKTGQGQLLIDKMAEGIQIVAGEIYQDLLSLGCQTLEPMSLGLKAEMSRTNRS